jgi:hypothetical protein
MEPIAMHELLLPMSSEQLLDEGQIDTLEQMLVVRHAMRSTEYAFIDAVKRCREVGIDWERIDLALHRDSRDQGEVEGWAILDGVFAAEARL